MPKYIVKLADKYLEWSTIVDAPVTQGMTREEFVDYYIRRYGETSRAEMVERLTRADATGTSALDDTLDGILRCNRAGDKEAELTKEQIIEKYCSD